MVSINSFSIVGGMDTPSHGYQHITFLRSDGLPLLLTNNERAFMIAQLQDMLSPRLLLQDIPPYRQLASCIDLLAFSITKQTIQLLIFSIDTAITDALTQRLRARLHHYQFSFRPHKTNQLEDIRITSTRLSGEQQALNYSVMMHLLHTDWENDRYSSVGFFLHDRRGDWMRLWRLTRLYDNDPLVYEGFLKDGIAARASTKQLLLTRQPFAS